MKTTLGFRSLCRVGLLLVGLALPAFLRAGDQAIDIFVEIPAVVALDVRGNLVFDLSKLPGPSSPNDCVNVYPPGSACRVATYDPTGADSVTVAVFDNTEGGSALLQEKVAPTWSRGLEGQVATTDLQARTANDASGKGLHAVNTVPAEIARAATEGRWVTMNRSFRLVAPASSLKETPKEGIQTTITYSVAHAE